MSDQDKITASETRHILKGFCDELLELPPDARNWLISLWEATQFIDDVADDDKITRPQLDNALNQLFIQMPANPFYITNQVQLLPILAVFIAKWQASDRLERQGRANEKTFMWRAGFYDVMLAVIAICYGVEEASRLAPDVLSLYGETYESYKREFPDG